MTKIIRCLNCGTMNTNNDYCSNCGTLLSNDLKRQLKEKEVKQKEIDEVIHKLENPNLAERLKRSTNIFYRIIGWILYSVFTIVSAIGAAIAWIVAMAAAG